MNILPKRKRGEISTKKYVIGAVAALEVAGFALLQEDMLGVHAAAGRAVGRAANAVVTGPVEAAVCAPEVIWSDDGYSKNCIGEERADNDTTNGNGVQNGGGQPQPAAPAQAPVGGVDHDLVERMENAGYKCGAQAVVTVEPGDSPVSVLGNTTAANEAAGNGVFSGVALQVGHTATSAVCS